MITPTALLCSLVLAAAGDIYHCRSKDGSTVFQDKPCDASAAGRLLSSKTKSADADLMRLRQALKKIERVDPPAPRQTPRPTPGTPMRTWIDRGPADQGLLAACSSQFFECASDDSAGMDRCVAAIPRCSNGRSSGCCPTECVSRYQDLRRAEFTPAQSVRDALLDDTIGSCAAR